MSQRQSLAFHEQKFESATDAVLKNGTRMLYVSLTIESVGHCLRYANIKLFSEPNFPVYVQDLRALRENTSQRKPVYLHFYPVWRISLISPETYTLLNENDRYIILKIIICVEIFNLTIVVILLGNFVFNKKTYSIWKL